MPEEVEFHFYICDDGSSDGTVPAIRTIIPEAGIYVGDGNLFWARGMFQAMCMAVKRTQLTRCQRQLLYRDS